MENQKIIIDPATVNNAVLKRLIEEVKAGPTNMVGRYNRTHSRHNRGM